MPAVTGVARIRRSQRGTMSIGLELGNLDKPNVVWHRVPHVCALGYFP